MRIGTFEKRSLQNSDPWFLALKYQKLVFDHRANPPLVAEELQGFIMRNGILQRIFQSKPIKTISIEKRESRVIDLDEATTAVD